MLLRDSRSSERGYALLTVVLVSAVLLVAGTVTIRMTRSQLRFAADEVAQTKATYIAEAGVERAIAQLDQDQASARSSTTYAIAPTSEVFGGGAYTFRIDQDPAYPTESQRKRILATGAFATATSRLAAHVFVNPLDPCASTIATAYNGNLRFVSNVNPSLFTGGSFNLFNGDLYSGGDTTFELLVSVRLGATGNVYTRGNFRTVFSPVLVSNLLSSTNANLFRGGTYPTAALGHVHVLGLPVSGVHFNNGIDGLQTTVAERQQPKIDREAIQKDPTTITVTKSSVPFGTWEAASNTWKLTTRNLASNVTYYVEGNVHATSLSLEGSVTAKIVATGWIVIDAFSVLSTSVVSGNKQRFTLLAGGDVYVGRSLLTALPFTVAPEATAIVAATTGVSSVAAVAHSNEFLIASETGQVWTKFAAATAFSQNRTCLLAATDATIVYTANIAGGVSPLY